MQLTLRSGSIAEIETPLAVIGVFVDEQLPAGLADVIDANDFTGEFKQTLLLPFVPALARQIGGNAQTQSAAAQRSIVAKRVLLLGLGTRADATPESLRCLYAHALNKMRESKVTSAAFEIPRLDQQDPEVILRAIADGVLLASYRFDRFKSSSGGQSLEPEIDEITLVGNGDTQTVQLAHTVFQGVALARDLGNEPPATCTPTRFAEVAREIAEHGGMELTVLDREQMRELGMGGMLAVSQAAHEPPKFIVIEYGRKHQGKTIALVGKGITFDSGGISIKPSDQMDLMKMDMMGAAAVLGTMSVIADLKPENVHIVGIVCATENLPGGHAYKPGDIVKAMNGMMIEVLDTDAEGRLVLADGLSYAQRYEPDAIIDLATLTGAVVIALGNHITGLVSNNAELTGRVKQSSEATGEQVWELPLRSEHREAIRSKIADIKNASGPAAASITAGAFLEHFVDGRPWVHLDIAGTARAQDQPKPYNEYGASGVGVRMLVDLIQRYANQN